MTNNRQSPAAKLFHLMYPKLNFYGVDGNWQRKIEAVAKEFQQYLEEQERQTSK